MNKITISIFGSKVFLEILKEINLFQRARIIFIDNDQNHVFKDKAGEQIIVFFANENNIDYFFRFKNKGIPIILVNDLENPIKRTDNISSLDQINKPFKMLNFEKKILSVLAKHRFKESSLILLNGYIIDKNERKLKKNNLELKLTEKEVNFLILFTSQENPINRDFILKNLWKYSPDANTHTVETHIHRLRKKVLQKFQDNNFIKNDDRGYYI